MTDQNSVAQPLWRWLAALAVLVNIAVSYFSNTRQFNGQSMGEVSAKYTTLLTPAGYAFSIWGLIFFSLLVYAVWQLLPGQRANPLPDEVAKPLLVANLGCAAWVLLFAHEQILASVLTMLAILAATVLAYGTARDLIRLQGVAPRWVSIPFALFLGWILVASVLNIAIGLHVAGLDVSLELSTMMAYGVLALMLGLVLVLTRVFQERTLPLVAAWALVGIWVARLSEHPDLAWVAMAGAVVVAILGLVLAQQGRKLQPWEVASAAAAEAARQQASH
ncbi:hypothetical protein GCM10023185_34900 [Hymenobacter saemangeumensis]|uniref:Tryptophan-rich sensory protein n=1 Tax=Hymenobacter saemangeumensis TaxID=1084522 RepID=A0ABP8IPP4_9BACT